jgi:hypothetical protein
MEQRSITQVQSSLGELYRHLLQHNLVDKVEKHAGQDGRLTLLCHRSKMQSLPSPVKTTMA